MALCKPQREPQYFQVRQLLQAEFSEPSKLNRAADAQGRLEQK